MLRHSRFYSTAIRNVCVANRGEIVHRVARTAQKLGIKATSVYTGPDKDLPSSTSAPVNLNLGPNTSGYIDIKRVVNVAKSSGCDAIHPGYGFLSENAQFADAVKKAGLIFIGPPVSAIEAMGAKDRSKEIMEEAKVPVVPGYHGSNQDAEFLSKKADEIGYPVLIKAVLGGGGKGMRIAENPGEFQSQLKASQNEAQAAFGDSRVLLEKYITCPRHVEVQVFADKYGNAIALGERDCSVQRRHQKVLEESPAPGLAEDTRRKIWEAACNAAKAVKYEGAGTVEFIFDNDTGLFYFMEMNTRLQVEHPVTEMVTGLDLVEWQLRIASGERLPIIDQESVKMTGHAFEARIYCEDAFQNFLPSSGKIVHMKLPTSGNPRTDFTFKEGSEISALYDPMVGKLIVHGANRSEALAKMELALEELEIAGPTTNIEFLKRIVAHKDFGSEDPQHLETGFIPKHQELFEQKDIPDKIYAQAAVGVMAHSSQALLASNPFNQFSGNAFQTRSIELSAGTTPGSEGKPVKVDVQQTGLNTYSVMVNGNGPYLVSGAFLDPYTKELRIEFENDVQYVNSFVIDGESIHLFNNGKHYAMTQPTAAWLVKALGKVEAKNSVVAPMPCTVAKNHVQAGDKVTKDQPLVVILSMKMETTIRSPRDGIIKSVTHYEGDIVKQGTALIEFEDEE